MEPSGLWFDQPTPYGGTAPTWLAAPFEILGLGRAPDGTAWGPVLRFSDPDRREKLFVAGRGRLASGGAEVRAELADQGLIVSPQRGKADKFVNCLATIECARRVTLVSATGWCGDRFVLPGEVIGQAGGETVLFTGAGDALNYRKSGSLAGWQARIAAMAEGNDLLTFVLSLGFVGALLRPLGWEGGGVHLRGGSSCGKSTLQHATGSIWGGGGAKGFVHDWRTTSNALEQLAYSHNDGVLIMDELKQIAAEEAGAATYMLVSGQAKARARADGSLRPRNEWRLFALSSGELSLGDHVSSSRKGERVYAGQELRLLDLAADMGLSNPDGSSMGVWQNLHGLATSFDAADALFKATESDYGHAGPAFLAAFVERRQEALTHAAALLDGFLRRVAKPGDTGQAQRAAQRFGAIAVAGELATIFGVLPWEPGAASASAQRLYDRWASSFGRDRSREASAILRQVRKVIESEGASFASWEDETDLGEAEPSRAGRDEQARGLKSWGYRAKVGGRLEFRFNLAGWDYATEGYGRAEAAKALHEAGYLVPGDAGNWAKKHSRKGQKLRFYTVKGELLEADIGE
jgi:hypothetical protein